MKSTARLHHGHRCLRLTEIRATADRETRGRPPLDSPFAGGGAHRSGQTKVQRRESFKRLSRPSMTCPLQWLQHEVACSPRSPLATDEQMSRRSGPERPQHARRRRVQGHGDHRRCAPTGDRERTLISDRRHTWPDERSATIKRRHGVVRSPADSCVTAPLIGRDEARLAKLSPAATRRSRQPSVSPRVPTSSP